MIADSQPFLCALGWHRPTPIPRWNDGYYFATCGRCGVDMVRTPFKRWQVPHGYRVVWHSEKPASLPSAQLVKEIAPPPIEQETLEPTPGPAPDTELPITEVLRNLDNEKPAGADAEAEQGPNEAALPTAEDAPVAADPRAEEAESPPASDQAEPLRSSKIPDFMDDAFEGDPLEYVAPAQVDEEPPPDPASPSPGPVAQASNALRELSRRRPKFLAGREGGIGAVIPGRTTAEQIGPAYRIPAAFLIAAAVALLALVYFVTRDGDPVPVAETNEAVSDTLPPAGPEVYVTASVLNCRSAPAVQADSVDLLVRGDAVMLIALDQEWASLAHEGRQCWVLARYLSVDRPLEESS